MVDDNQYSSAPYQSPARDLGNNIRFLTNPNEVIKKLENTYRSEIELSDGKRKAVGPPLMNELGINSVIGLMQSLVNQVNIMGNLDKDQVQGLTMYFADTLAKDLMMSRVKYEIEDMTARDKIFVTSVNLAFITCQRAFEQGDRKFWGKTTQEVYSNVTTNQKKRGILSAINPWSQGN